MKASILAVGDELLGTDRLDTNSLALTEVLRRRGVDLVSKAVVGDDVVEIAETLDALRERAELLLVTGGLGPTRDDLTREGLARLLGRSVAVDEELWTRIERGFRKLGRRIPRVNRKQAERVEGAEMLPNRAGVAPGQRIEDPAPVPRGTTYFLFPGVPRELHAIVEDALDPWLAARSEDGAGFDQVEVRVACLPESVVEERIAPVYERFGDGNVSVLARPGEIRLRLRAGGAVEGRPGRLAEMEEAVLDALGDAVFCVGPIEDGIEFEAAVGGLLSKPTALAMAAGARVRCGSDYGIGITGVAGPGGGSESRPVGTVHIAVAGPADSRSHFEARFPGDRARVRQLSTQFALEMLRRMLLSGAGPADALPWAAPSRMGPP